MAIFKTNPEKAIQRDIDAAIANQQRLTARLAENDQAIMRHGQTAKDCALGADDAGLEAAEALLRAAQVRAGSLQTAITEIEQRLAALEVKQGEIRDKRVRAETAAEIELLVRKLTEIGAEFVSLAQSLSEHTGKAVPIIFEANGVNNIVTICKSQVSEALEMVCKLLRAHGDAVIAGIAPAVLPRPDDPALVQAPASALLPEGHFTYRPAIKARTSYQYPSVG